MIVSTECGAYPAVLQVLSGFARDGFAIVAAVLWCGRGGGVRGSVTLPNCRYSGSVLAVCPRHCSQLSKYH